MHGEVRWKIIGGGYIICKASEDDHSKDIELMVCADRVRLLTDWCGGKKDIVLF